MTERFTDVLRRHNQDTWDQAVSHRFVTELFDGSIDDAVMAGYLVQDYRFLDSFLVLLGSAVASADALPPRLRLARFIGEIAGDENTYFLRAFEALGVSEEQRSEIPDTEPTAAFTALFREAADTREYAAILAVLLVAEWLYLDWATKAPKPLPDNFVHADWIILHDYPEFHDLVGFLRSELDRVGPAQRALAEDFFGRAVAIELAFFDASYAHPVTGAARLREAPTAGSSSSPR
ncbi:MAG: TenA family protein [Propioniciclava sp.]|uniref:TenA family protein n=1 Tax=Propioniciclava sp. TaxID=2038686 RepID=UPI0039E6D51A